MNKKPKFPLYAARYRRETYGLIAPPIFTASTQGVPFSCAGCGTVLLLAEPAQIHNVEIECARCRTRNLTSG